MSGESRSCIGIVKELRNVSLYEILRLQNIVSTRAAGDFFSYQVVRLSLAWINTLRARSIC